MYKTLGGYTWDGFINEPPPMDECAIDSNQNDVPTFDADQEESIKYSAQQFHLALESLKSVRFFFLIVFVVLMRFIF